MLEEFQISSKEIIPICVMATMSSGKSTFLNAILGEEVLPEKNEACTARPLKILNVPGTEEIKAYIQKNDGNKYVVDVSNSSTVSKINSDENVSSVMLVKDIHNLRNVGKTIVLVDTPGVNNSGDIRHAERTKKTLDELKQGVIVYILNATQIATNDDELLLQMVIHHVKKEKFVKILFVLNKIDMLDEEKESVLDTIENAREYIREHGLRDFEIFPLSALTAKTLRMKLNSKKMTKTESRHMEQAFLEYKVEEKSTLCFAHTYNRSRIQYDMGDYLVSEYALRRAIEDTGIVEIERSIEGNICSLLDVAPKGIKSLKEYTELEGVYSKKRKSKNYENYNGKILWTCKKCRQVNGEDSICLHCKTSNVQWKKM